MDILTTVILIVVLVLVLLIDYFYCVNKDPDTTPEEGHHPSVDKGIFH